MRLLVQISTNDRTTIAETGGKGDSLIRMLRAGFPVPYGVILTTRFFAPWFDGIQSLDKWTKLLNTSREEWGEICSELKQTAQDLPLTPEQIGTLEELYRILQQYDDGARFAVRSSSPDEDQESESFAGGYETRLCVPANEIVQAVRSCFASALDERVIAYKRKHGKNIQSPSMAVIVQRQIHSDVAGVGFSINPLTNDYDEAVIDANSGLGESVVGGLVIPDHYVINRVTGEILEKTPGTKQISIWPKESGGTYHKKNISSSEYALEDSQIKELLQIINRIEELYEKPMDMEWAFQGDRLYVLQARPITVYVPLPEEMLTPPGERRRLYMDASLSKGITTNTPLPSITMNWLYHFYSFLKEIAGIEFTPEGGIVFLAGNRMYINYSNMMWLMNTRNFIKTTYMNDVLMGDILSAIDEKKYRSVKRPKWFSLRIIFYLPRILWIMGRIFSVLFRALFFPEHALQFYKKKTSEYETKIEDAIRKTIPAGEYLETCSKIMSRQMLGVTMPVIFAVAIALVLVDFLVGKKSDARKEFAQNLTAGLSGDVVVEMGIAMYRMARMVDKNEFSDPDRLTERIRNREMSDEFMKSWDDFIARYGCRGPMEMDLASPRYADDPALVVRQMSFMTSGENEQDPQTAHLQRIRERREAYDTLMQRSGLFRRIMLPPLYKIIDLLAWTRDAAKHEVILFNYGLRKQLLHEGKRLQEEGNLDDLQDIFHLTFQDLEHAKLDSKADLRRVVAERSRFFNLLKAHVKKFPQMIDSRGRILRPVRGERRPGEYSGMAVSTGKATGKVVILDDPNEKSIEKGDVLVAYTTDPGWTPLFINASAIILEVGGTLQHGAVVAREFGKPCVVGIDRITSILKDGQRVEVDGNVGVVRILNHKE